MAGTHSQPEPTPRGAQTSQDRRNGRDYDPYEHAAELGLHVVYRPLRTANALWMPDFRTIVVHEGLRSVHRRNFLAHEIGHAVHGHRDDRPKHEAQADRFAALHLIDPEEAADVCRWAPDAQTAAAELRVTVRLLEAWFRANRAAG